MNKISDEDMERFIKLSMNNPRHCLYYKDPSSGGNEIAKTLINSHESFELTVPDELKKSILGHELFHMNSCTNTQFKRKYILSSIFPAFELDGAFDEKASRVIVRKSFSDFHYIYNSDIVPFQEAFALFYQCRLETTPRSFAARLINELDRKIPVLNHIMIDLEDIFERISEKNKSDILPFQIVSFMASMVFSTPDIIEQRVFDRFRVLRDEERIPEWKTYSEISNFYNQLFSDNEFSTMSLSLGTPESILELESFISYMKSNKDKLDKRRLEAFIFGVLSELDPLIGRISYFCDSLDTLENKRIIYCYFGDLIKGRKDVMTFLNITRANIKEMLDSQSFKKNARALKMFDADIKSMARIKEKAIRMCPGIDACIGKEKCVVRNILCTGFCNDILRLS